MALGLSQITGQKTKISPFFLDGLDALDEAALDTALAALAGLKSDGRLIGALSAPGSEALKSRVTARVEVVL